MESRVRIPLKVWMFVSCVCCVLCRQRPLRRAEHSFRGVLPGVCVCVCVCDLETSRVRRSRPQLGCCARGEEGEKGKRKFGFQCTFGSERNVCLRVFSHGLLVSCKQTEPEVFMQDTNRTPGILNAYLLNKVTVYLALQWEELAPLNCKEKAVSPVQRMSAFYV